MAAGDVTRASTSGMLQVEAGKLCEECGEMFADSDIPAHLATCELLRARAESEVDAAERAR